MPTHSSEDDQIEPMVANPYRGKTLSEMKELVERFLIISDLREKTRYLLRGAVLSRGMSKRTCFVREGHQSTDSDEDSPHSTTVDLESRPILSESPYLADDERVIVSEREERYLQREIDIADPKNKWKILLRLKSITRTVLWLVVCCSLGAVVQGMDETAVNGAQHFYGKAFGIEGGVPSGALGLTNAAPYLMSAVSCLFNHPVNRLLGGRCRVIFVTLIISSVACLIQAFAQSWQQLVAFRLILGLGIGLKSATIPIYAAECTPKKSRGALVMMWQMWTAFGLMLGYIFGVAFWRIGSGGCVVVDGRLTSDPKNLRLPCSLNWRLMLVAPAVLPMIPALYILFLPESPRFLVQAAQKALRQKKIEKAKKLYWKAYEALVSLNHTELQAGRELITLEHMLKNEHGSVESDYSWTKVVRRPWTRPRSRHALIASITVMFLQQFCGVNVLAYYSTPTLTNVAGYTTEKAFYFSLGFGIINFVFAIPAFFLMDTIGRRSLLLLTFPFLAFFQFMIAVATSRTVNPTAVTIGMYLFCAFYSIGEGPVPFVYAAESMPLHHRDYGMGIVTSINWLFNFILALTWPWFLRKFGSAGAFSWYGGWCVVGWFMIFFLVRETKEHSLEELHDIFTASNSRYRKFARKEIQFAWNRVVDRKNFRDEDRPNFIDELTEPGNLTGNELGLILDNLRLHTAPLQRD